MEAALAANLKAQDTLRSEMTRIAAAKAFNRAQVAALTQQWFSLQSLPRESPQPTPPAADLKRKWNRRFFYDSKSRIREPPPNPDTLQRRAIESRYFFHHVQPPWSKKENEALMAAVAECCCSNDATNTGSTSGMPEDHAESTSIDIDFARVAQTLSRSRKKKDPTKARTKQECQFQYKLLKKKESPFTKSELETISQRVSSVKEGSTPMFWEEIAAKLSLHSQTRRTAYDCLVAYHSRVKASSTTSVLSIASSSVWTMLEDELVLKFLAAAGPQMVVDSRNALLQGTLLQQLLPNKSKKQLFTRIQQSLLNPNLHRREWSPTEERRLAILMKLYHTVDPTLSSESAGVWRSDLFLASTHFHGRTIKSVADKWQRSINPDYSSRPFTTAEDQRLLAVLRRQPSMGWSELSSLHFKDRHPNRLLSRWSELATDQDIVNREQALQGLERTVGLRRRRLGALDNGRDEPQQADLDV
jgi:hypothetical protein